MLLITFIVPGSGIIKFDMGIFAQNYHMYVQSLSWAVEKKPKALSLKR